MQTTTTTSTAAHQMRFVIAATAISRAEFPQIQRTRLPRLLPSALHCSQRRTQFSVRHASRSSLAGVGR